MMTHAIQNVAATTYAAISAVGKSAAGNNSPAAGNLPGQTATDSASVSLSTAAQALLAASQSASGSSNTYDFTQMTPKQMQGVAQELFKAGKISIEDQLVLQSTGVPLGRQGQNGEFIELTDAEREHYMNTPVNYIDSVKSNIRFLEETGYANDPKSGYDDFKQLLATLQQYNATHSS